MFAVPFYYSDLTRLENLTLTITSSICAKCHAIPAHLSRLTLRLHEALQEGTAKWAAELRADVLEVVCMCRDIDLESVELALQGFGGMLVVSSGCTRS